MEQREPLTLPPDVVIRTEELCRERIHVVDGLLETQTVEDFYELAMELPFRRVERDFAADAHPIFSIDFQPETFDSEVQMGAEARKLLAQLHPQHTWRLSRAYINMSHYGDIEYPHCDCADEARDVTVLYYVNREWDYRWAGETMFYENKETRLAVLPKPGRFLVFPGRIEHIGSIPSRLCSVSRLTLAMKYQVA